MNFRQAVSVNANIGQPMQAVTSDDVLRDYSYPYTFKRPF